MGRRSTKTTKTGKFMNPTDQWSKLIWTSHTHALSLSLCRETNKKKRIKKGVAINVSMKTFLLLLYRTSSKELQLGKQS